VSLAPGTKLGPYEVVSPLGAGGMGEVYRARDPKLGRDVAIKVLPGALARDPQALARFEREARAVAALSHPNILSIFDFGCDEGTTYAVTELLEGETLRARLAAGPLPPAKAIDYAVQVARGLAAAHEKGIVHRDLKPENLFVSRDGHVKILDFGLARQVALLASADDTKSPTQANPTADGVILGTAAYMSPEQVRGEPADHRSDLFSFGCVLHEMVSGLRPFRRESAVETMNAILREEPAELPAAGGGPSGPLARVVATCLAKDPRERWQNAADLARELSWVGEASGHGAGKGSGSGALPSWRRAAGWAIAALAVAAAAAGIALFAARGRHVDRGPVVRFSVPAPEKATFERNVLGISFAPSPDGRRIAFVAGSGGRSVLWLWSIAEEAAAAVPDTDGAISPFWSPDGKSLAFFSDGRLKRVALSGGPAQTLCDAPFGQAGSWGTAGTIVFSEWTGEGEGLYRVPAEGGATAKLTLEDGQNASGARAWPSFLPDGEHFLYMTGMFRGLGEGYRVCVGHVGSRAAACLLQSDTRVQYVPPGLLLFARKGALLAQPFDAEKRIVAGSPAPVVERISLFVPTAGAEFAASADGRLLVYRRGLAVSRLVWLDRTGKEVGSVGEPGHFGLVRISPDGKRLAADVEDPATGGRDVWVYDLDTGIGSRLTFDPVDAGWPVWSPDGRQLMFGSASKGPPDIYVRDLDGQAGEKLVLAAPSTQFPADWSGDGRFAAYIDFSPTRRAQRQVFLLPLSGERKPFRLAGSPFSEFEPRFSPDSRFVAFVSEESGQAEVYVAAIDGSSGKRRVSPAGGSLPRWTGNGRELTFVGRDNDMMSVAVTPGKDLRFSAPTPLFRLPPFPLQSDYDVSSDGKRFLVNLGAEKARQPPLTAILGWQQRLERR
jgi:eukaryotic-like serine/threonine-protein kinase